MASHVALLERKKASADEGQQLSEVRKHHDLSKKKVKILEEELEKALQTSQTLEETVQTTRKKFNQLVDLIKDIWHEEVQNFSSGFRADNFSSKPNLSPSRQHQTQQKFLQVF